MGALKACLEQLPRENYVIAYYLLKFLYDTSQLAEANKMASSNLGIVFGPTLMRNKEESLTGMMNPMNNPAGTIAALIEKFPECFPEEPPELSQPVVPVKPVIAIPVKPTATGGTAPRSSGNQMNLADVMRGAAAKQGTIRPNPSPPVITEAKPPIPAKPVIPPKPTLNTTAAPTPAPAPIVATEPLKEYAQAQYDYTGDANLGQINFKAGDRIEILKKHPSGWWTGDLSGVKGLFPMNFVKVTTE